MLSKLRPTLTYANVVSTLCLFILLGGSSYAAVKLGKNAVKNKNIAANAVTSSKVKNGSLLSRDFKAGQLPTGPRGSTGPGGAKGDTGAPGQNGANGAPGTARAYAYVSLGGTLSTTKKKNVIGVTRASTGTYCVQLDTSIDASTVEGVVNIDYEEAGGIPSSA